MSTILHRKLVRDLIPDIIRRSGKNCVTRTLSDAEYIAALDTKLQEEMQEYLAEPAGSPGKIEELADLLEVLLAAAEAHGCARADLEAIRREKAEKRGAFNDRIWLEAVTE